MRTSEEYHLKFATFLQDSGINLSMVARLFEPAIGMPDDQNVQRIRVFIPDLHMISKTRQRAYPGYGFHANPDREQLMVKFLLAIGSFGRHLPDLTTMEVYQLGDFIDLWRESFSNDPSNVIVDNGEVCKLLFRGLRSSVNDSQLPVYCLRGNHDFTIMNWSSFASWQRGYFFDDNPMAVLHEDVFGLARGLARLARRAVVYLTGVKSGETNFSLNEFAATTTELNRRNDHAGRYVWTNDYWVGKQLPTIPDAPTGPVAANVLGADNSTKHELIDNACELAQEFFSKRQRKTNLMIIGHTHQPRIVKYKIDGRIFVLMDCGAWLENYWVGPDPNAQAKDIHPSQHIGLVIGNDLRIYQLD